MEAKQVLPRSEANHELRIKYSQNGREISDSLFRMVPFFWLKTDELDAHSAAKSLADSYGCGMAEVYIVSPQGNITHLRSAYSHKAVQS